VTIARTGRLAARIASVTALGAALAFTGGSAAFADSGLSVDPATGLADGQTVNVSGSGYTAGSTVYVVECLHDAWQCDTANLVRATVDADGSFTTPQVVHRSFDGVDPRTGEAGGPVDCAVSACDVLAWAGATESSAAAISFG
jgi:hypothetical protein